MSQTLTVSDGETLPTEEVLTGRAFAFGKSGSGKSNSASVIVEELLEDGHACLIVDTDGEYYGLKETYEVLHATGDEEGDLQVGPEHADRLATLALEENVPVILDVSSFLDPDDAEELVGRVARSLFAKAKKLRKPFLLVVEECHEYIPQNGGGFAVDHITRIARRGRKHGLGLLGISQRPANVDKDVVTQGNLLIWHRLTYKNDTGVVRDLYGSDIADAVEDLDDGDAFVEADWWDTVRRLQWREKNTFDAGATPGLEDTERPELRSIDEDVLDDVREAGDAARSKQERIEDLQEQLADARETIEELQAEKEQLEERNAWEEQMAERMLDGLGDLDLDLEIGGEGSIRADVMEVVEQKQALDEKVDELERELEAEQTRREELEAQTAELEEYRDRVEREEELHQLRGDFEELVLDRYPDLFNVEGDDRVENLRERIEKKDERVEELESELEERRRGHAPQPERSDFDDLLEKMESEPVQEAVDKAAATLSSNTETVWAVLVALSRAPDPPVHASDILGSVPVSHKDTVNRIFAALNDAGVTRVETGERRRKLYAVDEDSLDQLIEKKNESERVNEISEALAGGAE